MSQVEGMLQRMRRAFAGYYGWQARELYKIVKGGYVYSPILGRRRYLGRNPSPTEAANFPIQGGAADVMNIRLPGLVDVLGPHVRLLAQVHDAAVFEVPSCDVGMVAREINRYMTEPIEIGGYQVKLPIEVKIGERWS
jgi:DNA polymerase I-like protein with 3'-5' exonuclease and polymerase domains